MTGRLASWLFVPGDRPERFDKAARTAADHIVVDLEDAVPDSTKTEARSAVAEWLSLGGAWVRINAVTTSWHHDDLAAVAARPGLRGVVLPKAEMAADIARLVGMLPPGTPVVPLVETAAGVARAVELAAVPGVLTLAFGSIDYLLDIDAAAEDESLAYARGALVVAARAAGRPGPVDGVTTETRDLVVVEAESSAARRRGFAGKLCIHPRQVDTVNAAFAPSPADIAWAKHVAAGAAAQPDGGASAFALDGQMVDKPVLERARRVLSATHTDLTTQT